MAKKALINKQQQAAEVPRARLHALPAVRPARAPCTRSSCCAGSASGSWRTGRAAGGDEGVMVATKTKKVSSNVTDPVADLLTRIRNANIAVQGRAARAGLQACASRSWRSSRTEGYIDGFDARGRGRRTRRSAIRLKYGPRKRAHDHRASSGSPSPGAGSTRGRDELPRVHGRPRHRDRVHVARRHDGPRRVQERHRRRSPRLRVVMERMSRIGKQPIEIPSGVEVDVDDGNVVTVKGPRGSLTQTMHPNMRDRGRGRRQHASSGPTTRGSTASLHGLTALAAGQHGRGRDEGVREAAARSSASATAPR